MWFGVQHCRRRRERRAWTTSATRVSWTRRCSVWATHKHWRSILRPTCTYWSWTATTRSVWRATSPRTTAILCATSGRASRAPSLRSDFGWAPLSLFSLFTTKSWSNPLQRVGGRIGWCKSTPKSRLPDTKIKTRIPIWNLVKPRWNSLSWVKLRRTGKILLSEFQSSSQR